MPLPQERFVVVRQVKIGKGDWASIITYWEADAAKQALRRRLVDDGNDEVIDLLYCETDAQVQDG
jgi:hypothetical protein